MTRILASLALFLAACGGPRKGAPLREPHVPPPDSGAPDVATLLPVDAGNEEPPKADAPCEGDACACSLEELRGLVHQARESGALTRCAALAMRAVSFPGKLSRDEAATLLFVLREGASCAAAEGACSRAGELFRAYSLRKNPGSVDALEALAVEAQATLGRCVR